MKPVYHDLIIRPIVTEKTHRMMEHQTYTFEVHQNANKVEIRKAIEAVFKVKVERVATINVHPKPKRRGMFIGKTRAWKKAMVTLAEGQRIEFFEGANA